MLVSPAAARKSEWRKHRLIRPAIPPPRRCRRPVGTADEHAAVRSPRATDPAPCASQPCVVLSRSSSPTNQAAAEKTGEHSPLPQQQSTHDQPPQTSESANVNQPSSHDVQGMIADGPGGGIPAQTPISGRTTPGRDDRSGLRSGSSTSPAQKAMFRDVVDDGARRNRNRIRSDCGAGVAASEAANVFIARCAITGAYGETSTHPRGSRRLGSAGPPVSQARASVYVDVQGDLAADDDRTDGKALSQTSDPIEDSQTQSLQRTSAAEDRGTAGARKPAERLRTLKQMIRVPKLPPEVPDLSMFQIPKPVEKGERKCVRKYSPVADGFVGSELSVPPKQKRVRRFRGSRAPPAGGLELVKGGLQAFGQSVQTEIETREMNSIHGLDAALRESSEDLFDDGVVVSLLDSPQRLFQTIPSHPRHNEILSQEEGQGYHADRDVSIGWHGRPLAPITKPSRRRSVSPMMAFQLAGNTAPARLDTGEGKNEGEEEETMERPCEEARHESGEKADDGSSSEAGSSSDSTAGDGACVADAGNPLVERADDNTYEGSPDMLNASETVSDRIRSTPKHPRNEPALGQRYTSSYRRESQYREGLGDSATELTRPGQAARMQSSGMWMGVQEEIESTSPVKSRLPGIPEDEKKRMGSAMSSEALVPKKWQLVAAATAVPASSRQRTGHGTAEDSGNSRRRYTTYPKAYQRLKLSDHVPEGVPSVAENAFQCPVQTPRHFSTGVTIARSTIAEGRKPPIRRRSRVMVSESTRDYFSGAQRKLFARDDEHIDAKHLDGDHISPVTDGNGTGLAALSTQRHGFAQPYVRDDQYSQRRSGNRSAAASTQPWSVGTDYAIGVATVKDDDGLPSLLLDPPFL